MSSNLWVPCCAVGCCQAGSALTRAVWLCPEHRNEVRQALALPVEQPPPHLSGAVVYYVSWKGADTVKIGTTTNLRLRTRALARSGRPARVLVAEPGSYYLERKRHRQFASLRTDGSEEFCWAPALSDHVANLRRELRWNTARSR